MNDAEYRFDPEQAVAAAIDAAEEVSDPLDDLVERTRTDPGAPFAPDVLEELTALRKNDLARFETLRAQLKAAGCRVTVLDDALAGEDGDTGHDPAQGLSERSLGATAEQLVGRVEWSDRPPAGQCKGGATPDQEAAEGNHE